MFYITFLFYKLLINFRLLLDLIFFFLFLQTILELTYYYTSLGVLANISIA